MELLKLVIGWILTIFLGALTLIILYRIARNEINLDRLISEEGGEASLSRFQFLIFTFVIGMTLFYLIVLTGSYPQIPNQILALLGISGGSYVMAKGIQSSRDVSMVEAGKHTTESVRVEKVKHD
jgi:uncharacterized membrane protein